MKKRLVILFFALVIMAVLPFISAKREVPDISTPENDITEEKSDKNNNMREFKILDTSNNKIVNIDDREFCIGAVAYEMTPSFEKEALKAQCIACYTHFSRLRENPDSNLNGADFSADLSEGQYYMSDEFMQKKWGSMYEESRKAIKTAVDEVFGKILTDGDGNLIDAVYHAISSGQTEFAKDIFGFENKHLQAVSSAGDVNVSGYLSSKEISADRFKEIMLSENIKLESDPNTWIGDYEKTQSGTVKNIEIGNQSISGAKIRELFGLRSACFNIEYNGKKFIFTVYGYGHGVGMSQYGADYMARQGASYKEILYHYYKNCKITAA